MAGAEFAIRTEKLTKHYGSLIAVDELTLQIEPGQVVGLLGPNGAGKSTTIGMLAGLVRPTAGMIWLSGEAITSSRSPAFRRLGLMPESASFYPYLSARRNLQATAAAYGIAAREVDRTLERVGFAPDRADRPFRTYSQGMRQLVSLANALLGDPDILLLDEPTNGLDPARQREIRALLRELAAEGRCVVVSSHLLHDVEQVCDRVVILDKGRLVAEAPVAGLAPVDSTLRLKTTDDDRALSLLQRERPTWLREVARRGDGLVVHAPAERAGDLSALLARHDVYPTELVRQRGDLETLFLALTETGSSSG